MSVAPQFSQYECSSQITDSINRRIYDRNIPSAPLQPYLSVRPVMTKYSLMPIVDPRKPIHEPMEQLPTYSPHAVFNPGNTQSPWSGFSSSINTESELRNQIFALQNCSQAVYVPNSNSDLYHVQFKNITNQKQQPFPGLFSKEIFSPVNPNPSPSAVGFELFNNNTRVQVRGLTNVGEKC